MKILIPTHGRVNSQITYDNLCKQVRVNARLIVHPDEAKQHVEHGRRVIICEDQGKGMAKVRSWMFDWCVRTNTNKVLFLDDDLTLQKRQPDLRVIGASTLVQQLEMMKWVEESLDTYDHCAFTERNAAWSDENETRVATKGIQCVGYNIGRISRETDCRFNKDVPDWFFIEDYHMTLQLFRAGRPNLVSRLYRVNFGPSNAVGGCSLQRTQQSMEKAAKILESLHPEFVKAVQKETKTSFGGGTRWNVRVQWRKAYESSQK